jgi:hypothetical protein
MNCFRFASHADHVCSAIVEWYEIASPPASMKETRFTRVSKIERGPEKHAFEKVYNMFAWLAEIPTEPAVLPLLN